MGVLRTTATPSRAPSPPLKLKARSQLMIRRSLRMLLRRPFSGSTPTSLPRRKNLRKSRSLLRALPCQSFSLWPGPLVELQEACQVECLELEVCLTLVLLVEQVHLLLMILLLDLPLRKSIRIFLNKVK